jgi:hypothetical protein
MTLRDHLPHGCEYTPSDLVDRGNGTIVCDLNSWVLPAFPPHDVAVFSGVLEYVNDIEYLINNIKSSFNIIVASYCDLEQFPGRFLRRSKGWVNDHTSEAIQGVFFQSGFRCDHVESWHRQKIYRFVRESIAGGLGEGVIQSMPEG